ncbi:zinc-binding dehydrogenase [[Mycobacterium] vasticus]|uniref:Zinc-binding dehydrogenase n=1 Tax=[Mycobacterium] vasticus TaxID=2875777 RepID=A0ABU5Z3J5_9MYCO|nr:zinc-binding dehydrogenase [Mycolicibacter sp. MYC017]MEB3071720.1 zinc-binding dehydrogenase [Mycolicibacter sp. MYC017]
MSDGYGVEVDAVVLRSPDRPMKVERIRLRDVGPCDVRVRIDATGVCHSDLSLARAVLAQPLPAVLGHEACGTVLEAGSDVGDLAVGDRVILLWITPCDDCVHCARGEVHLCVNGAARGTEPYALSATDEPIYPGLTVGSFAEQTVVPAAAAVKVPDDITSADAALLGCAITTGVGAVTKTAAVRPNSTVLILGLGGVGLAAVQGAKLAGAKQIIAVDRNTDKGDLAAKLGATYFLPADDDTRKTVRTLTGGQGVDYAFDCVGSARTIRDAWGMARRGGNVCIVGIGGKDDAVSFSALELFHFARTLTGCVAGSLNAATDLPHYFDHVRSGRIDLTAMVTGHGGLADVERAMADIAAGRGIRTLVSPAGLP